MKIQYLKLVWFYFLEKDLQRRLKDYVSSNTHMKHHLASFFTTIDFNDKQSVINYLYVTAVLSIENITHRRKNFFSFNPNSKEDLLFLIYIENQRDVNSLTYLQRLLLADVVFKVGDKEFNYNGIAKENITNPIIIEVQNVPTTAASS